MPRVLQGPSHAVPCPHCNDPTDLRDEIQTFVDSMEAGGATIYSCDGCRRQVKVKDIQTVTIVVVETW